MAVARKHPDYKNPSLEDRVGSRWNWYKSESVRLPSAGVDKLFLTKFYEIDILVPKMCHRHPNGGGWVADTAYVSKNARVEPTGFVTDNAVVLGGTIVKNYAGVFGNGTVFGRAIIGTGFGWQKVYNDGFVFGRASFSSGEGEVFGIGREGSKAFGEVIILGGAGIIEGPDQGDVYGRYKPMEDANYIDVFYPTNPQMHSNIDPISRRTDLDLAVTNHDIRWNDFKHTLWADIHRLNHRDGFKPDSFNETV